MLRRSRGARRRPHRHHFHQARGQEARRERVTRRPARAAARAAVEVAARTGDSRAARASPPSSEPVPTPGGAQGSERRPPRGEGSGSATLAARTFDARGSARRERRPRARRTDSCGLTRRGAASGCFGQHRARRNRTRSRPRSEQRGYRPEGLRIWKVSGRYRPRPARVRFARSAGGGAHDRAGPTVVSDPNCLYACTREFAPRGAREPTFARRERNTSCLLPRWPLHDTARPRSRFTRP